MIRQQCVNSLKPGDTSMRQRIRPQSVQPMACRLFGAKPLSEPMLSYCQFPPWEQNFHSRKCISKRRLQYCGHFVSASMAMCSGTSSSTQRHHSFSVLLCHETVSCHFEEIIITGGIRRQPVMKISSKWLQCSAEVLEEWGQMTHYHYNDVIMNTMASQITSLTIVYSTVYSSTDQRKHQSFASLAFMWGIHRWPVNSPHKGSVTRKMFPFDDFIITLENMRTLVTFWGQFYYTAIISNLWGHGPLQTKQLGTFLILLCKMFPFSSLCITLRLDSVCEWPIEPKPLQLATSNSDTGTFVGQ